LLQGDGNLWWSGGINSGVRYAIKNLGCEYTLWWNNDIITENNYFNTLFEILDNDHVEIAGSKIYYADRPNVIWSMGGIFNTKTGEKYMIGMNEYDSDQQNLVKEVDWLPGMGTVIHKSVYEKIGYVDNESFPQYHGDSDFTFRAKLAGFKIIVYPNLKIWNDKSNSGLLHDNKYKTLVNSLKSIKSNYHVGKDIHFYKRHATSIFAYQTLAVKYCYYVGGFFKWKILNTLGLTKKK
jgi:GT2 family glycosyltransferase